jgi:signal transduction histidine kinase
MLLEQEHMVVEHRLHTSRGLVPVQAELHRFKSAGSPAILLVLKDLGDREAAEWALRRRDAQLARMSSATRAMNEVLEEGEVLRRLVASAMEVLRATEGMAGVFDGDVLRYRECRDLDGVRPLDLELSVDAGIPGMVWQSSGVFRTNDAPADIPRHPAFDAVFDPVTVLAAPILGRDGELLGCVELHDKVGGEVFSEDDGLVLLGLAASGAVALENARSLRELRQMREELLDGEEHLRQLAGELSRTEERERRRVAEDLHDRIGQELAVMRIRLGQLTAATGTSEGISQLRDLLESAIAETRALTFEISPPMLYTLGLDAAAEWLCEQVEQQHGLACTLVSDLPPRDQRSPLSDDVRGLLYRSLHELLMNVVKHAQASHVQVRLTLVGERLLLKVSDDGTGFVLDDASTSDTFGLFSIHERLSAIGGSMDVRTAPGEGTVITLDSPAHL